MLGAEVSIYENNLLPSPVNSTVDQIQRVEGLWACFSSVKAYFDGFFNLDTFPLLTYIYVSIVSFVFSFTLRTITSCLWFRILLCFEVVFDVADHIYKGF
jgi:hypothetical protein